jgi:PD-(D/E)XK endonuclease
VNTSDQGTQTEAILLSALAKAGYTVLVPFGPCRYDLAIDRRDGSRLLTVQCKTGRLRNGCILWSAASVHVLTQKRTDYRGQVDLFGIWCPDLPDQAYLIPVEEVGVSEGVLRVDPTQKFARVNHTYRWAKDYEITALSSSQAQDAALSKR